MRAYTSTLCHKHYRTKFLSAFAVFILCFTTLCDKVVSDLWQIGGFSPASSTNEIDRHDIAEILCGGV
jgi:hypothetical protein